MTQRLLHPSSMLAALMLGGAPCRAPAAAAADAPQKPNVLLIVADDLGYADIGVNGCTDIPTPNIDSLARNGVRFTDGYVSAPLCSPTRAGLMTGRYQQRFGHETNPGPARGADSRFGLPADQKTLGERMKALGYATCAVGKWHLGYRPGTRPQDRGFDEFYGFLGGAHSYLKNEDEANPVMRGAARAEVTYTTDDFAREAVAFVERRHEQPWFLYLAFNAVHTPLDTLESYQKRVAGTLKGDERRTKMGAMLIAMDDGIGAVLEALRKHALEERTLVFFVSDNGGPTPGNGSLNTPFSGRKGQMLEGGIRVPFLAQWKGRIPAGQVYSQPVIALDIVPTAAAAAGAPIAPEERLDGVNLLPYLTGENPAPPHERLFWRMREQWAVRSGAWKLLKLTGESSPRLFDLAGDPAEATDLAATEPARAAELRAAYDAWSAQLAQPAFRPASAARQRRQRGASGGSAR